MIEGWAPGQTWTTRRRENLALPGFERRPLCRPARSQSLNRLHYPGSVYKGSSTLNVIQSLVTIDADVRLKKFSLDHRLHKASSVDPVRQHLHAVHSPTPSICAIDKIFYYYPPI
jgi:hypothetical protein